MRSLITTSPRRAAARRAAIAATLTAAFIASACGGTTDTPGADAAAPSTTVPTANKVGGIFTGPADSAPFEGGQLKYGIDAEPEGLDPSRYAFSQAGHAVASAVYDTIATLDADSKPVPYFAEKIEPNADFTEWTITLPEGVKFHDGSAADSYAVLTGMDALRKSPITGAALKMIKDLRADDATHLVFTLVRPTRSFPVLLTTQAGYVYSPKMLDDPQLAKAPIGTGPFVFQSHTDGKIWSLTKNPDYRVKGLPHLAKLDFIPVAEAPERNKQLLSGDLDLIQTNNGPQIKELRQHPELKVVENRYGDKTFIMLNTEKPPFDKLSARKAIATATDPAKWRRDVTGDVAQPISSPYGPEQPGYLEDNGFPKFDLEASKKFVAEYKAETGTDIEFVIAALDEPASSSHVQGLADTFNGVGMKVTVQLFPQINLLAQVATGTYQLSQFRLFGQPDPDADVHFYRSTTVPEGGGISINFPRFKDEKVDAAIDRAVASDDPAVRNEAYQEVNRIFAAQVPFVWLGQLTWTVAANARVNGIAGATNGSIATVGSKTWIAELSLSQ